MPRSDRVRSFSITAFSCALALAAAGLLAGPLLSDVGVVREGMPWWVLIPAFTAAELVVVHVQARRESLSVSFAEVPLVLGLVFVSPVELVVASVLGSMLGLLYRRQSGLKLFFNLSMFALEAALAAAVYHLLLGSAGPTELRGLLAALGTVVVTDLVSAAALTVVIWLKVGEYDEGVLVEAVTSGLVAALANTSVGLLAAVLVEGRPFALALLLAVVAVLAVAYRGYSSLSSGHARLESLYRFTRQVHRQDDTDAVAETILRQARDVLTAQTSRLLLLTPAGDHAVASSGSAFGGTDDTDVEEWRLDEEDVLRVRAPGALESWWRPAAEGVAVMRRAGRGAEATATAMAAPLDVDGEVVAVLVVADRPHHLGPFTTEDLRLFESLANHAAVSLHKTRLVDQLRQEAETQEHVALHDALTGLPNRRHALRALSDELTRVPLTAVMVLDIDGFTQINDALGYATGDEVLHAVGRRLVSLTGDMQRVARLGNDEFVVILRGVPNAGEAAGRAEEVLAAVCGPVTLGGLEIDVRACAGLAVAPGHGSEASLLLQRADAALYVAKRDRSTVRTWDEISEGDSARRLALLNDLRTAVAQRRIEVHFQPKVHPATLEPLGAEALARWTHAAHGRVAPDEFIPLAEQSGLIHPLTEVVLRTAATQCATWRATHPDFSVAVNLSARSLTDPHLLPLIRSALTDADLPAHALTLEITETAVMTDTTQSLSVLHDLKALGVRLSIDDFGTGQSSLAYLKQLPVHEVKIDRSFLVGSEVDDRAIVRATIDLGHTMGLHVVAEGVEDEQTLHRLAEWGCDSVQGFHISRPLAASAFRRWLVDVAHTRTPAR